VTKSQARCKALITKDVNRLVASGVMMNAAWTSDRKELPILRDLDFDRHLDAT
jgi:hypothetical protein